MKENLELGRIAESISDWNPFLYCEEKESQITNCDFCIHRNKVDDDEFDLQEIKRNKNEW